MSAVKKPTLDEISLRMKREGDNKDRGGDKGSHSQDYLFEYDTLLTPLRDTPVKFLEVGVFQGKSMALWTEYFCKDAEVWGADIELGRFKSKRPELEKNGFFGPDSAQLKLAKMDSTNTASVKAANLPVFDAILDDGPHRGTQQMKTFKNLFYDHLKPGGVYIVEDTHPEESWEYFKSMADKLNFYHLTPSQQTTMRQTMGKKDIENRTKAQTDIDSRLVKSIEFVRRRIIIHRQPW